ncbi:arsenite methyltransferase [Methanobacterium spitsbergense]|uniref:Arsenite methyltransferase n=1 Tax=Methanobacterium spitsbergense TaxID=2874285 RepID=A0A8T5V429_9EURY|nr:arsenite methyltransferase [Methanobacterium spitsbergense]MBZ2166425.1 arsenite methyltransferase [Methanobacterium spitsbergense]
MEEKKVKEFVKERYSKIATNEESSNSCSCCGGEENSIIKQAQAAGYTIEEIKSIPSDAVFGLGCGNPTALAEINSGETVLDLGSGGGIDVFLAANKVGDMGKVIGVDMTSEMVETAVKNAREGSYENVEFKVGEIENLPIEDNSIDLIISNCVINLTPDKLKAYREAYRVLKPDGRILVSDIVTDGEIPTEIRKNFKAWAGCIAGALEKQEYIDTINKAGFKDVEIVSQHIFTEPNMDERLIGKIISVQIKAYRRLNKESEKCGCGETSETVNDSCNDGSKESKEDRCCESESDDKSVEVGCCESKSVDEPKEDSGCGCGLDNEYPDESVVNNPDKPKVVADADFIKELENYAHSIGIKDIGYAQITPEILIKDKFIQYPNAIVLTMEMGKEIIEATPGPEAQKLNDSAYEKLGNLSYEISDYLREHGYATEVAHPYGGIVKFSQLGQKAGLGWIGQSGLLITPELGPRQKISAIFVSIANLPLKDGNEHSWITDYCEKCGKCIKACPEKALIEKEVCCGEKETEFIQKLCIGCSEGCTYCIEGCPFDQKEYTHIKERFDKMNAKLKSKK